MTNQTIDDITQNGMSEKAELVRRIRMHEEFIRGRRKRGGFYENPDELYKKFMKDFTRIGHYQTDDSVVLVYAKNGSVSIHRDPAHPEPLPVPGYIRVEKYSLDKMRKNQMPGASAANQIGDYPASVTDYQIIPEKLPKISPYARNLGRTLLNIIANCEGKEYAIEIEPDMDPLLEIFLGIANSHNEKSENMERAGF